MIHDHLGDQMNFSHYNSKYGGAAQPRRSGPGRACGGACPLQTWSLLAVHSRRVGYAGIRGGQRMRRAIEQRTPLAVCNGGITSLDVSCRPPCPACYHAPSSLMSKFCLLLCHNIYKEIELCLSLDPLEHYTTRTFKMFMGRV